MAIWTAMAIGTPAAVDPAHLLAGDHREAVVGAHAAVGLVVLQAEQADGPQLGEQLVGREGPGPLPLVDVRRDLPLEQVPEGLAEEPVLVGLDHPRNVPPAPSAPARPLHCGHVTRSVAAVRPRAHGASDVTLDSPHNRNALSGASWPSWTGRPRQRRGDAGVRAVVLTAAGTVFCSGADLAERLQPRRPTPVTCPTSSTRIVDLPQPVVARVNGHARAGGLGLIAAGDLAVPPRSATFAFSEVRVGVAPGHDRRAGPAGDGPAGLRPLRPDRGDLRRRPRRPPRACSPRRGRRGRLDAWVDGSDRRAAPGARPAAIGRHQGGCCAAARQLAGTRPWPSAAATVGRAVRRRRRRRGHGRLLGEAPARLGTDGVSTSLRSASPHRRATEFSRQPDGHGGRWPTRCAGPARPRSSRAAASATSSAIGPGASCWPASASRPWSTRAPRCSSCPRWPACRPTTPWGAGWWWPWPRCRAPSAW